MLGSTELAIVVLEDPGHFSAEAGKAGRKKERRKKRIEKRWCQTAELDRRSGDCDSAGPVPFERGRGR
jgi:hypothetical protein